jgi:hypothetical protein
MTRKSRALRRKQKEINDKIYQEPKQNIKEKKKYCENISEKVLNKQNIFLYIYSYIYDINIDTKYKLIQTNKFETNKLYMLFESAKCDDTYKLLDNKYLYNQYEHLYLNKILIKNDYNIVNNTILKILRILSNNDIDKRELLIEKNIENYNLNDIFLLPDSDIINKLPFEHLIKIAGIDENEVYKMKCYFFNKYLKNKIINNI